MTLSNEARRERSKQAQVNRMGYRNLPVIYGSKTHMVLEFAKFFNRPVTNREIFEFSPRFKEIREVTDGFNDLRTRGLAVRVGEKHQITKLGVDVLYLCARIHVEKTSTYTRTVKY
jgi:hypothetical protein